MASPNPYIRKKAALCAMRIVRKVDEIEDKFNNKIGNLLEDPRLMMIFLTDFKSKSWPKNWTCAEWSYLMISWTLSE